jgi:hypothetical protein
MSVHVAHDVRVVGQIERPLRDVPAADMADILENQFDVGLPLDPEIVFELLNRALLAEGSVGSTER